MDTGRRTLTGVRLVVISVHFIALFTFTISLTTRSWIHIQEPLPHLDLPPPPPAPMYTGTEVPLEFEEGGEDEGLMMMPDQLQCAVLSDAGLWSLCFRLACVVAPNSTILESITDPECHTPDFFNQDWMPGNKDGDTTNAIIRGTRKAALTLVVSYGLLLVGVFSGVRGTLTRNKHAVFGAIFFVLSGLFLLASILLYMLAVNDEVGHRPKPKAGDPGPKFDYAYNWSMWNAVTSYLFVNASAVVIVYLSQRRMKDDEKEPQEAEFTRSAMRKLVQLINVTSATTTQEAGTSSGRRSMEMVEFSPITVA